jgi:hypothetical protein
MLARLFSACLTGIEAALVRVEVDVSHGLPNFDRRAPRPGDPREPGPDPRGPRNSGFEFPQVRITVNLAPADLRKEGVSFDLRSRSACWPPPARSSRMARRLAGRRRAGARRRHPSGPRRPADGAVAAARAEVGGCLLAPGNAGEAASSTASASTRRRRSPGRGLPQQRAGRRRRLRGPSRAAGGRLGGRHGLRGRARAGARQAALEIAAAGGPAC